MPSYIWLMWLQTDAHERASFNWHSRCLVFSLSEYPKLGQCRNGFISFKLMEGTKTRLFEILQVSGFNWRFFLMQMLYSSMSIIALAGDILFWGCPSTVCPMFDLLKRASLNARFTPSASQPQLSLLFSADEQINSLVMNNYCYSSTKASHTVATVIKSWKEDP